MTTPQAIILSAVKEALSRILEVSEDSGTATGGTNATLEDAAKNWQTDVWAGATIHIFKNGTEYLRTVSANTANTITFAALPAGVEVAAGDGWAIRRPVAAVDVSDRAARLLGVIQNLTQWGGVALTGRDISLDLANLDIALSAFRDALRGAGTRDFTTLETDVEGILAQLDITLSALKAVGVETPRTLSNIYDQLANTLARNIAQIGGIAQTGADWTPLLQNLDIALSTRASESALTALRDKFSNVYTVSRGLDLTVAQSITLDTEGRTIIEVWAQASAATTFHLDVSEDGVTWIEDWVTYSAVTEVKEGYFNGWRYLRLRSDASGAVGDTVSLGLTANR